MIECEYIITIIPIIIIIIIICFYYYLSSRYARDYSTANT